MDRTEQPNTIFKCGYPRNIRAKYELAAQKSYANYRLHGVPPQ
jgi:hypothetical protein